VTQLDLVGSATGQLQSQGYIVDGIVLNGVDANKARLLETSQGEYIWSDPGNGVGMRHVGHSGRHQPEHPGGQWLVGAFQQSTVLFSRQSLSVMGSASVSI
jgi:hypothetical protein